MLHGYYNFSSNIADGYWERRAFIRHWWRIYSGDTRWTPPHFPSLHRALTRGNCEYLTRQRPQLIYLQALQDTRRPNDTGLPSASSALWETTVGAAVLLLDPRRHDRTAYLGLLHCVNDVESLERFVGIALEQAARAGYRRLVGPTGLSPHLQSGVLQDHFHTTPPLHTPYNPPYVPETMQGALFHFQSSRLYHISVDAAVDAAITEVGEPASGYANIVRLDDNWQRTLLPLFTQVFDDDDKFPQPDEEEASFLLDWVSAWPLSAWAAIQDGKPAGFVMLQPDLAGAVIRAKGGRNHLWRPWLAWRSRRSVKSGRLLFGGVLPEHRGNGIGNQLWQHALREAKAAGWQSLTIGPLPLSHPAVPFLKAKGAEPRQSYRLYTSEI